MSSTTPKASTAIAPPGATPDAGAAEAAEPEAVRPGGRAGHSGATAPGSSIDPTAGRVWRAIRGPLAIALMIFVVALGFAVISSRSKHGLLDPRAADPAGSRALAELLRSQGVTVDLVRTTEDARQKANAGSTLLVAFPDLLQRSQLAALTDVGARSMVLVAPGDDVLRALAPGIKSQGEADVDAREPACDLPAAQRAGDADIGGVTFTAAPSAAGRVTLCYAVNGEATLAALTVSGRNVAVMGTPEPLRNDMLDQHGNAALAMNLLGQQRRLVWYLPSLGDQSATERKSLYRLIPAGWKWGFAQVAIAVLLLAAWRMRRLGPVVTEPLPVLVRAAESVEGRARLYFRGKARDHAAEVLRSATRARLAPLAGLPAGSDATALVHGVAGHIGRSPDEVGGLLYGPIPDDDAALVRLADDLDALEGEVRRS
jgi:hypothetical protein